ncbi:Galactosyltransferase family protein [Actinidia rufa]|uniref:Galactosyltransferase family protein n=1 Tax=Actinidia rufa TaxID=165716 RepID=A0A7J0EA03_9ERIC|nr:Galactosyltransferase family protein [Actinidia rufa]
MQRKGSNNRLSGVTYRSPISTLMLSMFATMASFYVAGRLWQDAENRVHLIKELDRITGKTSLCNDIMIVREQQKKLSALKMELAAAKQEGFTSNLLPETNRTPKKKPLVVIGVLTRFGRKTNREAIRKAWMGTGRVPLFHVV